MMRLDKMRCDVCGMPCVSWSATEGGRCMSHSTYVGSLADAANRKGNEEAAVRYQHRLADGDYPSESIRRWMEEFVTKHLRTCKNT